MVGKEVLAASSVETTETATLPPIGWRKVSPNNQTAMAGPETHRQPLETPEHLKRWLQPGPTAPAVSISELVAQPATRIVIPSIKVDAFVDEGTDWESLKYKVGHHPGTANPGQWGNSDAAHHRANRDPHLLLSVFN